ncbi:hypothetical protein PY02_00145, partial [Staphylococcus aureus]
MGIGDLAVAVHEEVGAVAVEHPGLSAGERGRVEARGDAVTRCLDPEDLDLGIVEERVEQPHGVGAAADASHQRVGETPLLRQHLLSRLAADDRLEVAHHGRVGMGAGHRADAVERVGDVGD